MSKQSEMLGSFSREEMKVAIDEWLADHPDLPPMVAHALSSYLQLLDTLDEKSAAMRKLLGELRTAFGIIPKSEKRNNYGFKKPRRSIRLDLMEQIADARAKRKKHAKNMRRQDRRAKDFEARLKELDEIELSEEDLKAEEAADALFDEALSRGNGASDPECSLAGEELFSGLASEHRFIKEECKLADEVKAGASRTFTEERRRLDIEISVSTMVLLVEKAEVVGFDGEKTIVSASTAEHGPASMNVTWNFLSQMSILVGQFGMPMTRLAKLVSTPEEKIKSERIVRYFHYVARRLCDIYLHSFQKLADSAILSGDDTTIRTLEIKRALGHPDEPPPWQAYANRQLSSELIRNEEKPSLAAIVGASIDFVSLKKDSSQAAKRQFNTTLIHGRSRPDDPRSTIVFFRSHFGSFGDLLIQLLSSRSPENKTLTILSDLSSTNVVQSESFEIVQSGCTAHARRRFAKADDGDAHYKELCLSIFNLLYSHEECLELTSRNKENVLAVRQQCSRPLWDKMKSECEYIASKHSPSTTLGEAARYVINNFKPLTVHLSDPRLPHTNDLSERLLRPEKQIQAAALFRSTIEGRVALDVIRSVIQTCSAADVNAASYIEWVLRSNQDDIKLHPENYTPYARALQLESIEENSV